MALLTDFWYVVAESKDVKENKVVSAFLDGQWLAIYRDAKGTATVVLDKCLHRNARLSKGRVANGELICPYHGWKYGAQGCLKAIPSEGESFQTKPQRSLVSFSTQEKQGYIYVRTANQPSAGYEQQTPFSLPYYDTKGYQHVRLKHVFEADVPNCAENFIDVPHTTFVHPGIFRYQSKPQKIKSEVEIEHGNVHVRYLNESTNFGFFTIFLNRKRQPIYHEDHYYPPNITHVEYRFGKRMHFNIISQSVPLSDKVTHVYTDLVYDYGIWNIFAKPFVWFVAKRIIAQDVKIMGEQCQVFKKYGPEFMSTRADMQHVHIERIYQTLLDGGDIKIIPSRTTEVEFWL